MTTKGTVEWCYKELNIAKGCPNGCTYCYARSIANRFGWKKDWENIEIVEKKVKKGYMKLKNPTDKYDYMFPTSHDIVPEILNEYIIVLKKILKAGNTVLITTKANYDCIEEVKRAVWEWKDQVMFRFTITSISGKLLKIYEPNASDYEDRYLSLFDTWDEGWKTSVSIEPFLDKDPVYLITRFFGDSYPERLEHEYDGGYEGGYDIITDTVWLGIMSGKVPEELKANYTDENLRIIIDKINQLPEAIKSKIRLKDSIKNRGFTIE